MHFLLFFVFSLFLGTAIKCWECNSKYDARCGDAFSNYSVALVDCDQRQDTMDHLEIPKGKEELGKATICRKTVQTGKDP